MYSGIIIIILIIIYFLESYCQQRLNQNILKHTVFLLVIIDLTMNTEQTYLL